MNLRKIDFVFPAALVAYEVLTYLANDMYLPSLPTLENDFNTNDNLAKQTLLSWFLGSASIQLIMGPLSDRYGRKRVLLWGALSFILSSFICALTHQIDLFLVARFIQGSAVCSVVVAGYATIHELFSRQKAIKMIALMGSVTVIAPAIGPLAGAVMLEFGHWRHIFYFLGFGSVVTFALLLFSMPETHPTPTPMNLKHIFRDYRILVCDKRYLRYSLPFCLLFMTFIFWLVESPFLIMEEYALPTLTYGLMQTCVFGAYFMGSQLVAVLVHYIEPKRLIQKALMLSLLGAMLLVVSAFYFEKNGYALTATMSLLTFSSALASSPLNRLSIESSTLPMGVRMGLFAFMVAFFSTTATLIVTLFPGMNSHYLALFIALVTCMANGIYRHYAD